MMWFGLRVNKTVKSFNIDSDLMQLAGLLYMHFFFTSWFYKQNMTALCYIQVQIGLYAAEYESVCKLNGSM